MLITSFAARTFATNCWIIASAPGQECIIVDPGMPDVSLEVEEILHKYDLKPVAMIITHGHLDHTFSVQPLCEGYGIPAYIHSEDRVLLAQPERAHGAEFIESLGGVKFYEPPVVKELRNGEALEFPGISMRAIHAPGHTRGSLLFTVGEDTVLTGDVLFAGSIGRTDMPTGSSKDMEITLRKKILTLPDGMRVLPGHGAETTIGHERRTNPYLKNLAKHL